MKKIYLACPYSHHEPKVREYRFRAACIMAGKFMQQGHIVYSPISHSHPIAMECKLPLDWSYWKDVDEFFISVCDELWVLCLEGWEQSEGIKAELEIVERLKKPVKYIVIPRIENERKQLKLW